MSLIAISIFFVTLLGVYQARITLYEHVLPKLFSLKFLLIGFVVIGVAFSVVYSLIDIITYYAEMPRLFKNEFYENKILPDYYLDYLYFSFISQLTIGYGDITTINPFGKILTIMQGLLGAIFIGGLVAALLNLSREALNYLYISSIKFHYCAAEANHGSEIFNMSIALYRTKNSLFRNFVIELIAKYPDGDEFMIMRPSAMPPEIADNMAFPLARKDQYPRFCESDGRLAYKTFNVKPENIASRGFEGKAEAFSIPRLIVRYSYSFESRIYKKEVEIPNIEELGKLLLAPGRANTTETIYDKT